VFTTSGNQMIVFDPQSMSAVKTLSLTGSQLDISLGENGKGRLVGLTSKGVYELDPVKMEIVSTVNAPVPVNCGFALTDDAVYFGSKAELWRFVLPDLRTANSK
jgi:hypothetical protein